MSFWRKINTLNKGASAYSLIRIFFCVCLSVKVLKLRRVHELLKHGHDWIHLGLNVEELEANGTVQQGAAVIKFKNRAVGGD